MPRPEVVPLAARADAEHEIVAGIRKRVIEAEFEVADRIAVARLVALVRLGAEPEEAARERAAVAALRAQPAALFQQDAPAGQLDVVKPAAPDEGVVLLTLRRVGKEGPGELAPALLAKIDVHQRHAEARADVAVVEDEGRDHAAHEKALEDVARLEPPFRDVTPAIGIGEIRRAQDGRDAAVGLDPLQRIVGGVDVRDPGVDRIGRIDVVGARGAGERQQETETSQQTHGCLDLCFPSNGIGHSSGDFDGRLCALASMRGSSMLRIFGNLALAALIVFAGLAGWQLLRTGLAADAIANG